MSIGSRFVLAALAVALPACASSGDRAPTLALPPPNGGLDYQLGGAYEPTSDTKIVTRDRTEAPDPDRYPESPEGP